MVPGPVVLESGCFLMDQGLPKTVSLVMGFIGLEITKLSYSIVKVIFRLHWEVTAVEYQTDMKQWGHSVLTLLVRLSVKIFIGNIICINTHCADIAIECPSLDPPDNGMISYSKNPTNGSYILGTVATYSCSPGFGLSSTQSRECVSNGDSGTVGRFNGSEPSCGGKD